MILDEPDKGGNRTWTEISLDWLFYLVGVAIIAISLAKVLFTPHDALELHWFDSFIVVASSPTLLLIGLFWMILGMVYTYVNRNQKILTRRMWGLLHFLLTLIGSILISSPYYLYPGIGEPNIENPILYEQYFLNRDIFLAGVAIFALGQLLLLHLVRSRS